MNLNEFALLNNNNNRFKKRQLKVVCLQNGRSANRKRKASTITTSTSKSTDRWQSECNSITVTSNTTATIADELGIIIALTEGRGEASCEVGIAAMNIQHPELLLFQISDTMSYFKVLNKIHIINPFEIIVPITIQESRLVAYLKSTFPTVKIIAVDRSAFRKDSGQQFVRDICARDYNPVFLILQHKYYTLTAAGALRIYLETYKRKFYAKESMKVSYEESDYNTMIDVFVADKLELVSCALGDRMESVDRKNSSLKGILDHCVTKLGSRMLRSTILQPPNKREDIECRLNCVEELYKCPEKLLSIRDTLKKLKNIGHILSLATILKANAQYCDERHSNYVLLLNSFFDEMEPLKELLSSCKARFFYEMLATLNRPELHSLNEEFKTIIHEDARPTCGEQAKYSRCFAIKGGVSEVLDFVRNRLSSRLEEMREHVAEFAARVGYDLKLGNSQKKGYHMVMQIGPKQRSAFKKTSLPADVCQVDVMATMVTMKTIKLLTMSNFLDDTMGEIINISNTYLHKLLLEVQKNLSLLYVICEQVATLDLLQSMAQATAAGNKYTRPKFDDFTRIIDGRHPLLDFVLDSELITNDTIITPENRLQLITGPNGSGKSIYIRQVVLLQIMAQVGCFVPATSATFRICDRILARIYFEDNMECGASAFTLEMKDIQYFLTVITDKTLIIIDELCRSTAEREGTALAMAICEHLMRTPAFIYFTTHYTYITKLQQIYPHMRCWQLETKEIYQNNRKPKLHFTYKLIPGVVTLEGYGLALARFVWPDEVTRDCDEILAKINKSQKGSIDKKMVLKINLESLLVELKRQGKCTQEAAYKLILEYRESMAKLGVILNQLTDKPGITLDAAKLLLPRNLTQSEEVNVNLIVHDVQDAIAPTKSKITDDSDAFTEYSFLMQNRGLVKTTQQSEIIHSSASCSGLSTSKMTEIITRKKPVKILQNMIIRKANDNAYDKTTPSHNNGNSVMSTSHLLRATLPENYPKIADLESIIEQSNIEDFPITRSDNFQHPKTSFEFFSQKGKSITEKSQIHTSTNHKDDHIEMVTNKAECFVDAGENNDFDFSNIEKNIDNFNNSFHLNNSNLERTTEFVFLKDVKMIEVDYKCKSPKVQPFELFVAQEKQENIFDIYPSLHDDDLNSICEEMQVDIPYVKGNEILSEANNEFPHISNRSRENAISSSVTSYCFEKNLRAENTSTPLPVVQSPEFNIIESRLKYAQACLSLPSPLPPASVHTNLKDDEIDMNQINDFNTNIAKNVLSSYTTSTDAKTKTKTDDNQPSTSSNETVPRTDLYINNNRLTIKKRRTLLDSQALNNASDVENNLLETKEQLTFIPFHNDINTVDNDEPKDIHNVIDLSCSPGPSHDCTNRWLKKDTRNVPKKGSNYWNMEARRELNDFYHKKRNDVLQSKNTADIERYYQEILNRPSIRQLQASEVIMTARRTSCGDCVFDAPRKTKKFQPPFKTPVSAHKGDEIDCTMFSDANSRIFDEYLKYKRSVSGEVMSFREFKNQICK